MATRAEKTGKNWLFRAPSPSKVSLPYSTFNTKGLGAFMLYSVPLPDHPTRAI
jgi:hypothetical protein